MYSLFQNRGQKSGVEAVYTCNIGTWMWKQEAQEFSHPQVDSEFETNEGYMKHCL